MNVFTVSVLRGPAGFDQVVADRFTISYGFPSAAEVMKGIGLVERARSPEDAGRQIHNVSITIAGSDEFETRVLSATHSLTGEPVVLLISIMQ